MFFSIALVTALFTFARQALAVPGHNVNINLADTKCPNVSSNEHCVYLGSNGYTYGVTTPVTEAASCNVVVNGKGSNTCTFNDGQSTTLFCDAQNSIKVTFGSTSSVVTGMTGKVNYSWGQGGASNTSTIKGDSLSLAC